MSDTHSVASLNTINKRKRKLMSKYNKVSDQFEHDSNVSPQTDYIPRCSNIQSRSSSSSSNSTSTRSSTSSLCDSTSSLTNIHSKSSIFAPKFSNERSFSHQKSLSEKKVKNQLIHNLFSPSSKKKLKVNTLFETKSFSLRESPNNTNILMNNDKDLTNRKVFDKYKSLNIDESVKKPRRKRLFDPLSHMIDETSFENANSIEPAKITKIVHETINITKFNSPVLSQQNNSNISNGNNESIPAGQNQANEQSSNTSNSNLFDPNLSVNIFQINFLIS